MLTFLPVNSSTESQPNFFIIRNIPLIAKKRDSLSSCFPLDESIPNIVTFTPGIVTRGTFGPINFSVVGVTRANFTLVEFTGVHYNESIAYTYTSSRYNTNISILRKIISSYWFFRFEMHLFYLNRLFHGWI